MHLLLNLALMGLLLGISSPQAAYAAIKNKKEAETISWSIPWQAHPQLSYDVEFNNVEDKSGVVTGFTMRYVADVNTRRLSDGYEQTWSSRDYQVDLLVENPMMRAFLDSAIKASIDKPLVADLNGEGELIAVRDIDGWARLLRSLYTPIFDQIANEGVAKLNEPERSEALAKVQQQMAPMIDGMTSAAVVKSELEETPSVYNAFSGGSYDTNQLRTVKTEIESPLGGPPFPATVNVELKRDSDFALVHLTTRIDAIKAKPALINAIYVLMPFIKEMPDAEKEIAKVLNDFDITSEVTYRIHLQTGVLHELIVVERKNLPANKDTETTRMRLRESIAK